MARTRMLIGKAVRTASTHVVLVVAAAVALVTMLFVPPDAAYLGYFDAKTLACLLCLLAVVESLRSIGFFDALARAAIRRFKTLRSLVAALVALAFVASPFVTNDMALIMFLPLSTIALLSSGNERMLPFTFIMQAIAANLGGIILPFGNPQNIFLHSRFGMPLIDFAFTMALPFSVALALIALCCWRGVKPEPLELADGSLAAGAPVPRGKAALYLGLFVLVLGMVFRFVPLALGTALVLVALVAADRRALRRIDFELLATFACFFVFAGNMARMPAVEALFTQLMGSAPMLTSVAVSQVISNVPAAIALSPFADGWQAILVGVNVGGVGTLVGSLASLIAFNQFRAVRRTFKMRPGVRELSNGRYFALFTGYNVLFLAVLLAVCLMVGYR